MPLLLKDLHRIEDSANLLIKKYKVSEPAVLVDEIAKKVGLDVISYDLGDDISGTLVIENGRAFIGYNSTHPKGRQRFTIAHELGHFILHNNDKSEQLFVDKDFLVKYRSANNYTQTEVKHEQEANAFAAALLMPKSLVSAEIKKKEYAEMPEHELIEKLAKRFEVSVPAMTYRLNNLNFWFHSLY